MYTYILVKQMQTAPTSFQTIFQKKYQIQRNSTEFIKIYIFIGIFFKIWLPWMMSHQKISDLTESTGIILYTTWSRISCKIRSIILLFCVYWIVLWYDQSGWALISDLRFPGTTSAKCIKHIQLDLMQLSKI